MVVHMGYAGMNLDALIAAHKPPLESVCEVDRTHVRHVSLLTNYYKQVDSCVRAQSTCDPHKLL
jgi:hypothetical protein